MVYILKVIICRQHGACFRGLALGRGGARYGGERALFIPLRVPLRSLQHGGEREICGSLPSWHNETLPLDITL